MRLLKAENEAFEGSESEERRGEERQGIRLRLSSGKGRYWDLGSISVYS
jgi:hypothetical protein